jgi:hypothetical protein
MAHEELINQPAAPAGAQPSQLAGVSPASRLQKFWPQAPIVWFTHVECVFHIERMTDSFDRYCHLVAVLPPDTVRLVIDIIE